MAVSGRTLLGSIALHLAAASLVGVGLVAQSLPLKSSIIYVGDLGTTKAAGVDRPFLKSRLSKSQVEPVQTGGYSLSVDEVSAESAWLAEYRNDVEYALRRDVSAMKSAALILQIAITAEGQVTEHALVVSSGNSQIDQQILAVVKQIQIRAPARTSNLVVQIPIRIL